MGKFGNKTVIVTGASSGIGAETAVAFAKEGANLTICARNEERLNQTATRCETAGSKVVKLIGDITSIEYLKSVITKTVEAFGTIDVLVNNAGVAEKVKSIVEIEVDGYENIFHTNVRAPVFLSKFAYPYLKKTKGCVVNVSSAFSLKPIPYGTEYAMTKSALDHFTRCFAAEGAPFGVRVNSINPGASNTPMITASEKAIEWAKDAHPFGIIELGAIAEGILFLSSSSYVTGICLPIDSGFLVKV